MMKNKTRNVKIKNTESGEVFLDYGKISNPSAFRFSLIGNIIQNAATDVTLMIDTNLRMADKPAALDEAWLAQLNLRYAVMPVQSNPQQFFGIKINTLSGSKVRKEQRIVVELVGSAFPAELIKAIAQYDILLGFGRKKMFEEICRIYPANGDGIIFNPDFFEDSLYDSAICARVRSTFHLEQYLKAVGDEMAL